MKGKLRSRIPQTSDKLGGPIAFGLDRLLSATKFYRKPLPLDHPSDRRLDLARIDQAYIRNYRARIKRVLDTMPWSEIEQSIARLPKEIRRTLRRLAEET